MRGLTGRVGIILLSQFLLNVCQVAALSGACRDCALDPSTCRRISGLYTVTVLTQGTYNPVVVVPAPACHINITEFSASNNYLAVKTQSGQGIINSYWRTVPPGQYPGAGSQFLYDRESSTCKGSCVSSEGPTNEPIVVQVLYYDKNPGIAYEFTLPNNVPFAPFDGTSAGSRLVTEQETSPLSAGRQLSPASHAHRRRHRQHRIVHDSNSPNTTSLFSGEYYTGSQSSRSEGRPDGTAALQAGVKASQQGQAGTFDYTGSRYGSHTLGGRGMSYTYLGPDSQQQSQLPVQDYTDKGTRRQAGGSYRPVSSNVLRKAPLPQYVPPADFREAPSHAAQQAQHGHSSLSAGTHYHYDNQNQLADHVGNSVNSQSLASLGSSQYTWKISGFTACSQSCGGGRQKTNVVCVLLHGRTQVVVTPENCASHQMPRVQTVECNNSPCEASWEAEEWSACSTTCGSGTQTRTVECRQRLSSTLTLKVSADQCRQENRPAIAQQCEKTLCSYWKLGPWGECSKHCGGGERFRQVQCVDKFESQIPAGYCTGRIPAEVELCNSKACKNQWWLSDWAADCSEPCGQGVRNRTALCMNNKGEVIPEESCGHQEMPATLEDCRSDAGCRGSWFTGTWDKCSADCGQGIRRRPVICLRRSVGSLAIVRDEECDASVKPEAQESCVSSACNAVWFTSPWSGCSVSCGDGQRTREVQCIEENRKLSLGCSAAAKPATNEVCRMHQCPHPAPQKHAGHKVQHINRSSSPSHREPLGNVDIGDVSDMGEDITGTSQRGGWRPLTPQVSELRLPDSNCHDTYWNCLMVTQARLCSYDYYKQLCCQSCKKV